MGDDSDPEYFVIIRVEDGFESIESVRAVFANGREVEGIGSPAYWSPDVSSLWLEKAGSLYAVQVTQFAGTDSEAEDIAVGVGQLVSSIP